MNDSFLRGVYVSPGAVAAAPDYVRRLVEEAGIDLFVLRAGFDPAASDPTLEQAAEIVRRLGAEVWLLIGAWWGEGMAAGADAMRSVCDWPAYGTKLAHESRWRMRAPGGEADEAVAAAVRWLGERLQPDGVCLTHARFRHPADIPGLFEVAGGEFAQQMAAAESPSLSGRGWGGFASQTTGPSPSSSSSLSGRGVTSETLRQACRRIDATLRRMSAVEVERAADGEGLISFLDRLNGEPIFSRWFAFRCRIVERSMQEVRKATAARFGVNAYGPIASVLCGQDYRGLASSCDFLQPLLGFVRWHVLQPVGSWARFLLERVRDLPEGRAIQVASGMFHLHDVSLPPCLADYEAEGEGPPALIEAIVHRQLDLASEQRDGAPPLMPVLRGNDWPATLVARLSRLVERPQFAGVLYQGTDALAGPAPGEGWS